MKKPLLLLFAALFFSIASSFAQQDSIYEKVDDEVSLEELMNMKVTVASQKGSTLRETPGIVTVITEDEIKASGARDFVDVMRLVPGFDFGSDVGDQVGMFVRGNWANEGKILIMQDGVPLNENSYGTVYLTDYILLSNIKKIEIIRGPGSAVYGGLAGLAVINIITKSGEDLKGGNVTASYGMSNGSTLRNNLQMAVGTKTKSGVEMDLSGNVNQSKFSNNTVYDNVSGTPINYKDSSSIKNYSVSAHAGYKGLTIRAFQSSYYNQRVDLPKESVYNNRTNIQVDYLIKINSKLSIRPKVLWQHQAPWNYNDSARVYNAINNRYLGNVVINYDLNEKVNFLAGAEYFNDNSNMQYPNDSLALFINGTKKLHYTNIAAFAQATFTSKIANLTIGARYNKHSAFNDAFVPRIALTKAIKNFHFKALYSAAFKAPVMENIDYNDSIKPEKISTIEFETGYKLSNKMWVTVNVFNQNIKDPIVYYSDANGSNASSSYRNFHRASTQGLEFEYRYKAKKAFATVTYSYYQNNKTDVSYYLIPGKSSLLRGAPANKITFNGSVTLVKNFSMSPTVVFYSPKYNYSQDSLGKVTYTKYGSNVLMHLYFKYDNLLLKGLDVGFGVYNIFAQNLFYVSAYSSSVRALPYTGREFVLKASYTF